MNAIPNHSIRTIIKNVFLFNCANELLIFPEIFIQIHCYHEPKTIFAHVSEAVVKRPSAKDSIDIHFTGNNR